MSNIPRKFVAEPFEYHQEIELRIDSLTNLGIGLGRIDGWVVMVPFALPGELIKAKVYRNRPNYSDADLVEVLEPASERIEPVCKLFGECGGCQYQHMSYDAQLAWKKQQVTEGLERIGGIKVEVHDPIGSPKQFGYRSKLTPHYPKRTPGEFPIGFHRVGTRSQMIDVYNCPIATDEINEALPEARNRVRNEKGKKKGGTLLMRHTLEGVTSKHSDIVSEKVGDLVINFNAGDFFQNNPFALPELVRYVLAEASNSKTTSLVDAYCGSGLFALSAASHFDQVAGVEVSQRAIEWARANAAANHMENVRFIAGQAEAIFEGLEFDGSSTAMIIDPPRSGCDEAFIRQLIDFAPVRLVYVSCDPATQARDLKMLTEDGGYKILKVQPFDLFPQTRHIENVVTLDKA
ncbi:class I SAM-dependent RNA methyltransferase [Rubellicoccus peritrichatus]|uniref:Class I SAM-dependent RNA methyltransferase n=1 Tax=Rubellicoccus peritrichatus TaxID=3080537 RepID=A0AAQ3QVE0_9BACT|nr:class I SAM-dependent RNA methyltransferase [Puniceicoccus sp. CR14]WOO40785.1 class I SAM-dependent RNA methyltransferase [Puniceicoccus sp. CR14]